MSLSAKTSPAPSEARERVIHKNHIRQSICRWCYEKLSFDQLCGIAVRLGYGGIDLVGPEDFPTLKKFNLIGTMTPSHGITKGLNHSENHVECLAAIRKSISATGAAGFPNVICFSGNREGMEPDEGLKNCAAAIKQIIPEAQKHNVTICLELLNSKIDHPDYMADNSNWGVKLVQAVGSERFKLLYDIYHMQIMEGNVIATIRAYHDYFGHYHTAGVPGRHEIDESQELNYPAIVQAIMNTGYKGWLAQEFVPVRDMIDSLTQAGKICDI